MQIAEMYLHEIRHARNTWCDKSTALLQVKVRMKQDYLVVLCNLCYGNPAMPSIRTLLVA